VVVLDDADPGTAIAIAGFKPVRGTARRPVKQMPIRESGKGPNIARDRGGNRIE